jgi:hypothetical protein
MNNYEYIIASLPLLSLDASNVQVDADEVIAEIRSQCSKKDNALIDFLLEGYNQDTLGRDFYLKALSHRDRFIREYFAFDLNLRNAKVRYINGALGRAPMQDIVVLDQSEDAQQPEPDPELDAVFVADDLIQRERKIDDFIWEKVENMVLMELFTMDRILAFIVKLRIIDRWMKLDENTGREMFRRLVDEIRGTFQGVKYE